MKILLIEPFSGISGDMFISALLDAGLDRKKLLKEIKKLNLKKEVGIEITDIKDNSISATQIKVHEKAKKIRTIKEIKNIITQSKLDKETKAKSLKMIDILAKAEKKIHRSVPHFHELGELDTVIDIVGAIAGLKLLKIDKVFSKPVNVGGGAIKIAHGTMPVPAPATAEILKGIPFYSRGPEHEMVTPTGAVILKELVNSFNIPQLIIHSIGYGAGTRRFKDFPNLLRVSIGEYKEKRGNKILIETNIDDLRADILSYVMEKLFKAGALDVYFTSIYMKKNRPGILLSCLCSENLKEKLLEIIFTETTTLGVRIFYPERIELEREYIYERSNFGRIKTKISRYKGRIVSRKPEYEEAVKIAKKEKIPLKNIIK